MFKLGRLAAIFGTILNGMMLLFLFSCLFTSYTGYEKQLFNGLSVSSWIMLLFTGAIFLALGHKEFRKPDLEDDEEQKRRPSVAFCAAPAFLLYIATARSIRSMFVRGHLQARQTAASNTSSSLPVAPRASMFPIDEDVEMNVLDNGDGKCTVIESKTVTDKRGQSATHSVTRTLPLASCQKKKKKKKTEAKVATKSDNSDSPYA